MKSRLKRSLKYIEDAMLLHSKLMKEFKNKDPSSNDNLSSRKSNQKDVMTSVLYTFNIILLTSKFYYFQFKKITSHNHFFFNYTNYFLPYSQTFFNSQR